MGFLELSHASARPDRPAVIVAELYCLAVILHFGSRNYILPIELQFRSCYLNDLARLECDVLAVKIK